MANDNGYPEERTDTARLVISVQRDIQLPRFNRQSYEAEVSESSIVESSVIQVQAVVNVVCICCQL